MNLKAIKISATTNSNTFYLYSSIYIYNLEHLRLYPRIIKKLFNASYESYGKHINKPSNNLENPKSYYSDISLYQITKIW